MFRFRIEYQGVGVAPAVRTNRSITEISARVILHSASRGVSHGPGSFIGALVKSLGPR
jgi:hypothetical protein